MAEPQVRAQELSMLDSLLGAAAAGHPQCALIEGTRSLSGATLSTAFVARHPELSITRASGSSWERELHGGLLEQLGISVAEGVTWIDAGREALARLRSMAAEYPALLILDSVEHADFFSLEALAYALRRLANTPLLTVATAGLPAEPDSPAAVFAEAVGARRLRLPNTALAALPAAARALVEAASVLGGTPSAAKAGRLAGLSTDDPSEIIAAADAAWRAGLLECSGGAGSLRLGFPDATIQAAVHEGLSPAHRADLHTRAAQLAVGTRERIGHLVAAAVMPDAALAAEADGLAAAEAAEGDWQAAAEALLASSRLHTDPELRRARLLGATDALIGAGDLARAALAQPQIEALSQSPARDAVLAYYAIHKGQARRAGTLLERAWTGCSDEEDPDESARIAQHRVLDSLARWDIPALLEWTATAVRLAGPDSSAGIEARAMLGLGLGSAGRLDEARRAYDELSASPHLGARDQRLHLGRGWLALALDDLDAARLALRAAIPTAPRPGSLRIALWAHAWLARAELAAGNWDEALAVCESGLALNAPVRMDLVAPLLHWTAAQIKALRGDSASATRHSDLAASSPEGYPVMHLGAAMAAASIAESGADYQGVLRAFDPVLRLDRSRGIDEPGFWPWQDVYANALVMTGRLDEADAFLIPLEEAAEAADRRSTIARLGYVRGRILGAQGRTDEAVERFEAALRRLDGLTMPYGTARVRFAYGQTLRRAGRRRDATVVLAAARDDFRRLGADVYVRRCDRELQAAGTGAFQGPRDATIPTSVPSSGHQTATFTAQEEAVAGLIAQGVSNRDAARELFVSVKTVQYHLTRIYAKLGISSRTELAALFNQASRLEHEEAGDTERAQ